jgi:hypothetical protein
MVLPFLLFSQPKPGNRRIDWGIGVQLNSGLGLFTYGKLQKDLDLPKALNQDSIKFFMKGLTTTYAATGELFFFERMLIYGMYQMDFSDASETARGQAKVNTTLYGGGIGFAVLNNGDFYVAPRVGFLTGTSKLRLSNYHTEPIQFGDVSIRSNDRAYFHAPVSVLDLGLTVRHLIPSVEGVIVGGALGTMLPIRTSNWQTEGSSQAVQNVQQYKLNAYYLRISVGFGYYNTKGISTESKLQRKASISVETPSEPNSETDNPSTPEKEKKKRKKGEEIYFE